MIGFILLFLSLLCKAVLSLATLPNGLIVSGSSDRSIRLWNIYQHTTDTTTSNSAGNTSGGTYNSSDYAMKENINFTDACVRVLEGQKVSGCLIV